MSADRIYAFRSVHPDFRSSRGFIWPFPGQEAVAAGPFTDRPNDGCPAHDGDGICLATTAAGMASGSIPAITVLVCSYDPADLLGTEPDGSKVRVRRCRVESVHDLPAVLRGDTEAHPALPTRADLTRADLTRADLTGADLTGADLTRADLTGADLTRADLTGADLSWANLYGANLTGADLTGADLSWANLYGANLSGANLTGADLTGAYADRYTCLPLNCGWVVNGGRIEKDK